MPSHNAPSNIDATLLEMLAQSGLDITSNADKLAKIGYAPLEASQPTHNAENTLKTQNIAFGRLTVFGRFTVEHKHVSIDQNAFIIASIANLTDLAQWHSLAMYYGISTVSGLVERLNRNDISHTRQHILRRLRCQNPFFWVDGDVLTLHNEKTAYRALYERLRRDTTQITFDTGDVKERGQLIADYEPFTSHRVILPLIKDAQTLNALAMAVLMHNKDNHSVKRSQAYIRAVMGIGSNTTVQTYKDIAIAQNWLVVERGGISYDDNHQRRYVANEYTSTLQTHYVKVAHYRDVTRHQYYFDSHNELRDCQNVAPFGYEVKTVSSKGWAYFERKNINCTEDINNLWNTTHQRPSAMSETPQNTVQRALSDVATSVSALGSPQNIDELVYDIIRYQDLDIAFDAMLANERKQSAANDTGDVIIDGVMALFNADQRALMPTKTNSNDPLQWRFAVGGD